MTPTQNKDIAARLGIHPVSLSRLRSGDRRPSLDLMYKIEKLGWSLHRQTQAHKAKDKHEYSRQFRAFLEEKYGIPADTVDD